MVRINQWYATYNYLIGTVYGRGVYFAKSATYSASSQYSPPDAYNHNHKHMFLAKVLTGDYVRGDSTLIQPPKKSPGTGRYDSCVDKTNNPTIFVVFRDSQVYPAYLITFMWMI